MASLTPRVHILRGNNLITRFLSATRATDATTFTSSSSSMGSLPRLRIVMDLDECMVHSKDLLFGKSRRYTTDERLRLSKKHKDNGAVLIEDFAVYIRPNLTTFLSGIAEIADVYAYTAGTEGYAKHVFNHIDPKNSIFRHILYRHNCVPVRGPIRSFLIPLQSGQQQYLKDLRRFGDEIFVPERTVLVDNNPISFQLQPQNGLLVPDYTGCGSQAGDAHLLEALAVLKEMTTVSDVRPLLKRRLGSQS